jgi:hypothetical protein
LGFSKLVPKAWGNPADSKIVPTTMWRNGFMATFQRGADFGYSINETMKRNELQLGKMQFPILTIPALELAFFD